MSQNAPGRPRKREDDAEAALEVLRKADWGMSIRSVAAALNRPTMSIYRALLLSASVAPSDYESLKIESLEYPDSEPVESVYAAREGIAKWSSVLGGWYWHENEDVFKERARENQQIGLDEMRRVTVIDKGARNVAATSLRLANNRVVRWLARLAARLGDPSGLEMLNELREDPEGPLRELRIPPLRSFFELLRTPLGKRVAALRGVEYSEQDVNALERMWKQSFRVRDERKDL